MSREARIENEGYYYHIIARGQRKNPIFFSEKDYKKYLNFIIASLSKTDSELAVYCLMRNHCHLLVKRNQDPLEKLMRSLQTKYALYFNTRYKLVGHVFQGRYKSFPVLNEKYLFTIINYIHNNPVKAGLCKAISDYGFSSASLYNKPSIINHSLDNKISIIDYNKIDTNIINNFDKLINNENNYIGTKNEYKSLEKRKDGRERSKTLEKRNKKLKEKNIKKDISLLLKSININKEIIEDFKWQKSKSKSIARLVYLLNNLGYNQSEIARALNCHKSTICKILNKEINKINERP